MRETNLMTKKDIRLALCAMLLALSVSAEAQQPKKVPRIGYLSAFHELLSPPVPSQFGGLCTSVAT